MPAGYSALKYFQQFSAFLLHHLLRLLSGVDMGHGMGVMGSNPISGMHMYIYCDVPGSPCLSKTGSVYGQSFFFLKFLGSMEAPLVGVRFRPPVNGPKGSLGPCLVAARSPVVWWRPHPTGTGQYVCFKGFNIVSPFMVCATHK